RSGLADQVMQGPATPADLARDLGLPADKLGRVVAYLRAHELLAVDDAGRVSATARTARMREWAGVWQQAINTLAAGAELLPAMRSGRTGFEQKFGQTVFEHFAADPELSGRFA